MKKKYKFVEDFAKEELIVLRNAHKQLIQLQSWLYKNHLNILREYEKSLGLNIEMHFAYWNANSPQTKTQQVGANQTAVDLKENKTEDNYALPKIYYCKKCDRYTDVRFISDKQGGRFKSYCYKCHDEMLEPIYLNSPQTKPDIKHGCQSCVDGEVATSFRRDKTEDTNSQQELNRRKGRTSQLDAKRLNHNLADTRKGNEEILGNAKLYKIGLRDGKEMARKEFLEILDKDIENWKPLLLNHCRETVIKQLKELKQKLGDKNE